MVFDWLSEEAQRTQAASRLLDDVADRQQVAAGPIEQHDAREFDHVRCTSFAIETWTWALRSVGDSVRTQVSPGDQR